MYIHERGLLCTPSHYAKRTAGNFSGHGHGYASAPRRHDRIQGHPGRPAGDLAGRRFSQPHEPVGEETGGVGGSAAGAAAARREQAVAGDVFALVRDGEGGTPSE